MNNNLKATDQTKTAKSAFKIKQKVKYKIMFTCLVNIKLNIHVPVVKK